MTKQYFPDWDERDIKSICYRKKQEIMRSNQKKGLEKYDTRDLSERMREFSRFSDLLKNANRK
jgi:hypothetical protein